MSKTKQTTTTAGMALAVLSFVSGSMALRTVGIELDFSPRIGAAAEAWEYITSALVGGTNTIGGAAFLASAALEAPEPAQETRAEVATLCEAGAPEVVHALAVSDTQEAIKRKASRRVASHQKRAMRIVITADANSGTAEAVRVSLPVIPLEKLMIKQLTRSLKGIRIERKSSAVDLPATWVSSPAVKKAALRTAAKLDCEKKKKEAERESLRAPRRQPETADEIDFVPHVGPFSVTSGN